MINSDCPSTSHTRFPSLQGGCARLTELGPQPLGRLCRGFAALVLCGAVAGCVDPVTVAEPPPPSELSPQESRAVELRFLRFDVTDFDKVLTLADLRAFPQSTLEQTWLLDLNLEALITTGLEQVTNTPPEQGYALPPPAQNLWRLLNLTPANADLSGTSLEELLAVGSAVGLPPGLILGDLIGIDQNERVVPTELTAEAVLTNVISTHPNTQLRRGPVTASNPEGLYPVAPNSIPVSLADVASNFANLAERFGPAAANPKNPEAPRHPGFIRSASGLVAAEENFRMTVRANLNALPYKGVDANLASEASVSSTASQIETLFDFSDPDWLRLEGLAEDLALEELIMVIYENDTFIPGGVSREPLPLGNSPVWATPAWQFEHLIADAARRKAAEIPAHCSAYGPEGSVEPPFEAVNVCIDATGWTEIDVDESVVLENPPPEPSYFWDILLEVAQTRLHDGDIPEGAADMEVTLRDVPIGITTADLVAQIRQNLAANPTGLLDIAQLLTESTTGEADFYYYVPTEETPAELRGDYLYFIAPEDIPENEEGQPARPYAYEYVGFFADPALTEKVSWAIAIDGDTEHEKVRIEPGMVLYMQDDQGRRFSITVGEKSSRYRVSLTLTRI